MTTVGRATTAASGAPSPEHGSSARPLPPTGPPTASAPSKQSKAHRRRLARTRRLFAFDRGLGSRLVAGADEAGRGLPRRAAGGGGGADRLRGALSRRPPLAGRAARLEADEARAARGDVPGGAAGGSPGQRGGPLCAGDRRPRPARDQHRGALQRAGAAGAGRRGDLPGRRLLAARLHGRRTGRWSKATAPAPRSPPPR